MAAGAAEEVGKIRWRVLAAWSDLEYFVVDVGRLFARCQLASLCTPFLRGPLRLHVQTNRTNDPFSALDARNSQMLLRLLMDTARNVHQICE